MEREGVPTAYLDVSVQPIRAPGGDIIYLLFEARDITELKAAQEQLRQSQKMEALGQLTGGIAHDFNNLLTVVVGGLDIIAKRAADAKLKRYAENALAAAERGARLTGQLLAFSRVQRLEVRPTYVAPLIQNMRPLLRNVLGPGITKQFDLDEAMMPVMADPTQLEVAVLNLAINARDAMPDGGVLTFATKHVRRPRRPRARGRRLCRADHQRHRHRHAAGGRRARVRALLHHQGGRQGHRPRPVDGLWHGAPVGRHRADREHAAARGPRSSSCSARPTASVSRSGRGRRRSRRPPAPRRRRCRSWSSTTTPTCAAFIVDGARGAGLSRPPGERRARRASPRRRARRPISSSSTSSCPACPAPTSPARSCAKRPDQPILFVSGYSETEAVKRTAPDAPLLAKPFRAEALQKAVRAALAPPA